MTVEKTAKKTARQRKGASPSEIKVAGKPKTLASAASVKLNERVTKFMPWMALIANSDESHVDATHIPSWVEAYVSEHGLGGLYEFNRSIHLEVSPVPEPKAVRAFAAIVLAGFLNEALVRAVQRDVLAQDVLDAGQWTKFPSELDDTDAIALDKAFELAFPEEALAMRYMVDVRYASTPQRTSATLALLIFRLIATAEPIRLLNFTTQLLRTVPFVSVLGQLFDVDDYIVRVLLVEMGLQVEAPPPSPATTDAEDDED